MTRATLSRKKPHWSRALRKIGACDDAVTWAKKQPSLASAWKKCERGDWMLWLVGKATTSVPWSYERKPLVAAAVDCARLALPTAGKWREVLTEQLDVFAAWCAGKATTDQAMAAREKTREAWRAAAYDAAYADYDAAYDAYAAYACATYAAYDAAYAAAAARTRVLAQCAEITRKHFPKPPRLPT